MNIIHLTKQECGGATRYAQILHSKLIDSGHNSILVNDSYIRSSGQKPSRRRFLNKISARLIRQVQLDFYHQFDYLSEFNIAKILDSADIIHIHSLSSWIPYRQILCSAPANANLVVTLHDLWPITGGCVVYNNCDAYQSSCNHCPILKYPFNSFLPKHELKLRKTLYSSRPVYFIANSEWTLELARRASVLQGLPPLSMIHPGIETDIFRPVLSEQKLASRDLYSIPRSKYILLAGCSSLTDINKNIESTLRIASHVNNMLDGNLQLVLFGEGVISAPDHLDVLLLGPIQDRKSLAKVYSMSDAFISTSRLETYGMTLLEAMASGIPVIAYRTGAIPHVLNEGRAGILVDLDDEATMAQSLFDVLTSESIRQSISEYALQLVYNRNSPDTLMKQHIDLYESIFRSAS